MTPSDLKYQVKNRGEDSHFFSRRSMKFFGDTMRNYGVRKASVKTNWNTEGQYIEGEGVAVECWELYRRRPVKLGLSKSTYFNATDFSVVHGEVV